MWFKLEDKRVSSGQAYVVRCSREVAGQTVTEELRTVRSRMSDRTWADVIPHKGARAELDFITAAIKDREMLKAEGLSFRRWLLLSGPPGDGKSTASSASSTRWRAKSP